jgi:KUP system potassium uptake protein
MQTEKGKHIDKITAASLLIALGIIYGDIGTSPLYVLKAVVLDRNIEEVFSTWWCILYFLDPGISNNIEIYRAYATGR